MRLLRSWPQDVPAGRARVEDDLPRHVMDGFDYRGLAAYGDDLLLVEWDIAVDLADLEHFAQHAAQEPDRPLAAPYRLFRASPYGDLPGWPEDAPWVWPLLHWEGEGSRPGPVPGDPDLPGSDTVMAQMGDPTCNGFSFGLVYLPHALLAQHEAEWQGRVSDTSFSVWHYHHTDVDPRICWHVRPAHLHYDTPREY